MSKAHGILLTAAMTFALACNGEEALGPLPPLPQDLDASGTYTLTSAVDVPPTVLATSQVNDFLTLLRLLRNDPAAAFFTVLDEAGVPLANELYGVLPGALKDVLRSSINDYVKGQPAGTGAVAELDRVLAFADSTLARFDLESTLTLPSGINESSTLGRGAEVSAPHRVDAIVFKVPGGAPIAVPRSVLENVLVAGVGGKLDADVKARLLSGGPGDVRLDLGDHFFGVAYGEAIFTALNGWGGETLRARLGRSFDCPAMGKAVAGRCVAFVCIGHASEITEICERGLDEAVEKLHDELADLDFRALRFEKGEAALSDQEASSSPRDGLVSRLHEGVWKASVDVGTGARQCRATFVGTRQ